jgi:thymidylate synthase
MVLPPCHYGFQVYTRELSLEERENLMDKIYGLTKETRIVPWNILDINKANIPTRAISLMWNQRSVDTFLGLPFNIASYALLLEIIAKTVNMVPDELIGNLGDVHLYSNHIEQAKEQIGRELTNDEWIDLMVKKHGMVLEGGDDKLPKRTREPYPLPKLNIKLHFNNEPSFVPEYWLTDDFELINYKSHSAIKAQLSN